jgi:hypothetical protein
MHNLTEDIGRKSWKGRIRHYFYYEIPHKAVHMYKIVACFESMSKAPTKQQQNYIITRHEHFNK